MPVRLRPCDQLRAVLQVQCDCRIGPRSTPASRVKPSRRDAPHAVAQRADGEHHAIIAPNISSDDMIGLCA